MEDGLIFDNDKTNVEQIFLTDQFNKCCPFFISIGMTYDQFWKDDPTIAKYYLEAYKIKEKREAEKAKWAMWEQGLYIYEAICDVSPILRAFSKTTKPLPYPEKPWGLEEDKEKQSKTNAQEELDKWRAQILFKNWADQTKKHFQKNKK